MEYSLERLKKCMCTDGFVDYDSVDLSGIDEDMIPILIELNEKDWVTCYSCSGHMEEIKKCGTWNAYIAFHLDNNTPPPNIPLYDLKDKKHNYSEKKELGKYNGYFYYWYGDKTKNEQEQEKERKELMKELLEWAKGLPVNDKYVSRTKIEDGWLIYDGMKLFEI